jgi:hypothetical protein
MLDQSEAVLVGTHCSGSRIKVSAAARKFYRITRVANNAAAKLIVVIVVVRRAVRAALRLAL